MERQRSQRRGWSALAPLLLLAAVVGRGGLVRVAQAQDTSADCTVTITQGSDGSLLSEVVCTGDAEPNVTMWNRAWRNSTAFTVINHTATFSWNGAAAVPIPESDGRFSEVTPALITIGFVPAAGGASPYGDYPPYGPTPSYGGTPYGSSTPPYGAGPPYGSSNPPYGSTPYGNYPGYPGGGGTSTALPTLYVKAVMRNLSLPIGAVSFVPGTFTQQAISGVMLTAFSELVIQDSEVDGVTSVVASEMTSFGAIKVVKDTVMATPSIIRVTNSVFRNGACSKDCGALLIQNRDAFELISIVDTNFTNNQGRGNGAALYVNACPVSEANMHINGSFFTNNYAKGDGAGAFLGFGCSPVIYQSTFSGNLAGKSGAGLSLRAVDSIISTLHVVDSTFADNIAAFDPCEAATCFDRIDRCGGAMHVNSPTTMRVEGSNFTGNTNLNGQNGAAVCYGQIIHDSRNLAVSCDGWAPLGSEGGIFRDCRFENNIAMFADGFGGAIFDWASDGITLDACTFVNNTAGNGGAMYALRTQTVNITGGTTFENCSATQFGGGAVAATHIQLTVSIDGAEFTSNICNSTDWSSSQGGAIYLEDSVEDLNGCDSLVNFTVTITNVIFEENECDTFGALAVNDIDDITVGPNVNFTRNIAAVAPSNGGAVGVSGTPDNKRLAHPHRARFTGCRFDSNQAQSEGGALIITGIWVPVIEDSLFFNNNVSTSSSVTLENYGGAVFVGELESDGITISRTRFIQNTAFGAGAMIVYASNLTMSDCEFIGNLCEETAGAYFWTQSATSVKPYQQTITNTTFRNNTAYYQGGAMLSQRSGVVLDGCTFEDNWALVAGGAGFFVLSSSIPGPAVGQPNTFGPLYPLPEGSFTPPTSGRGLETKGRVFLLNSVFTNNSASTAGGGAVAITQQTEMLVNNCTFSENISPQGYGGAISGTDCRGSINVYSSHFLNNSASTFGGAIYTTSCNLTLMDSKMAGNTAATAGALNSQLSIRDAASPGLALTELTHCECSDNLATAFNGGCVVADSVQLRLEGGSFTGNVARMGNGGVVSVSSQGSLRMSNVHNIAGNTGGFGGAIWLTNTRLVDINSSTISANSAITAGCVNADQVSCVIMQNTTIQNCKAIMTSGGMNFLFAVNSSGCTANDFASSLPSSVSPKLDAPSQQPISFVVYNSTFVNNSAFSGGGMGLQLNPGAGAYMQRLVMRANNASQTDGGGMYVQGSQFWDGTGAIKVQDSTFDSNTAQFGYGGAAFLINTVQSQAYQYRFTLANCTVEGNSASNGGGVATNGGGLFLDVSDGSVFESNTAVAPTVDGLTAIATGGCLHARGCQGLMVRGQSKFNSCNASAPGYSQGGAIMVDSCETLVVDQSSVSNSQANMGGGLAALHVQALLVVASTFQGNKAVGSPASLPSVIQNLIGAGGGAWIGGNTSGFLQGTQISDNVADTVGGGAVIHMKCPAAGGQTVLVASQRPWAPMFVTVPASYSDFLARLQGLAFDQCFSLTVKQSSIFGNQAYHAGGGLFLSSVTGFQSDSCDDLNHPVSKTTPLPSLGPYVAQSNISGLVNCSRVGAGAPKRSLLQDNTTVNTVVVGYGPDIATMAHRVDIERADTMAQVDPAVVELGGGNATVPQVRFVRSASGYEDVLVLPSASPLIFANVPVLVTDAAGQNIHDPLISSAITVTITPNVTALLEFSLIGQTVGVYDPVNKAYAFNGLGVRARVGRNYLFSYNVTSAIQGGDQVPLLNVTVIVPDCADGEVYALEKTACYKCRSGYYAFAQAPGAVADECLPCPSGAQCTGGAVLVPDDMNWHSAPNSTEVHQCVNYRACKRPDDKIQALQACQAAWYEFLNLRETMTNVELSGYAYDLLVKYNCTLLSVGDLYDRNAYGSLVCAEGYGGNMCGVCVPKYDGSKTALQSNSLCGSCGPQWQVILVSIAFFVVNMVLIIISVMSAMGEQILSNTIQFADIIGLLVMHMQYLVVVLRIQMSWPNEVVGLTRTVSAVTNFADQAIKVASLGCLSSTGTPESQAEYTMAGTLFIPAALLCAAMLFWAIFWLVRIYIIYPRMGIRMGPDLQLHHTLSYPEEEGQAPAGVSPAQVASLPFQQLDDDVAPTDVQAALAAAQPPLVTAATFAYRPTMRAVDLPSTYTKSGSAPANHYNASAAAAFAGAGMPSITEDHNGSVDPSDVNVSVPNNGDTNVRALPPPPLGDVSRAASAHYPVINGSPPLADPAVRSATTTEYRSGSFPLPPMFVPSTTFAHTSAPYGAAQEATGGGYGSMYAQQSPGAVPPTNHWAKLAAAVGNGSAVPPPINASYRTQGVYTADESDDRPSLSFHVPEKGKLMRNNSLIRWQLPGAEKMPVATSWFSSDDEARHARVIEEKFSLSLMEKLQLLDKYMPLPLQLAAVAINSAFVVYEGWCSAALSVFACQFIDSGTVDDPQPWYYANFQKATNPNGYWQLNMNQACYEGEHWYKWTPIGIVMSIVVCLGIPLATFLPVFLNRKTLTTAKTQLYWGWVYMRFYYNRVPYWAAFAQLELLALVITQTFTSGLESDLQQAAILQVVLLVILVVNTIVWPHVHQLMTLMSFLSFAVLTLTVAFSILIGDGTAWTLPAAAAGCVGALMIIINVLYGVLLLLVSYKHTQDILEENYEHARKRASMVITRFMRASKDAGTRVRSVAAEASRTLAKSTEDSRMVRSVVSAMGGGSKKDRSSPSSAPVSTRDAAAARAVQEVASEREAGPVLDQEKEGKQV